jgi:PEP-CTERM putative exosortase interaction domain
LQGVLAASDRRFASPDARSPDIGFRVASVPEPATGVLLLVGLAGFACRHRQK